MRFSGFLASVMICVSAASLLSACSDDTNELPTVPITEAAAISSFQNDARTAPATSPYWTQIPENFQCTAWDKNQGFQSGRFRAHAYRLSFQGELKVQLSANGSWNPVFYIFDDAGEPVWLKDQSGDHPSIRATFRANDDFSLYSDNDAPVVLYITDQASAEAGLSLPIAADASYLVSISEPCEDGNNNPDRPDVGLPEDMGDPNNTGTPDLPDDPDLPDEPDLEEDLQDMPDEPDLPDEPDVIDEPDIPDEPDMPDDPPFEAGPALQILEIDSSLGSGASDNDTEPARIWRTNSDFETCTLKTIPEDFSSGRYNVHRYSTLLSTEGVTIIELETLAGDWQPSLFLTDTSGNIIFTGETYGEDLDFLIDSVNTGQTGSTAGFAVLPPSNGSFFLYVSSWEAYNSVWDQGITTDARYRLSLRQECPP